MQKTCINWTTHKTQIAHSTSHEWLINAHQYPQDKGQMETFIRPWEVLPEELDDKPCLSLKFSKDLILYIAIL